MGTTLFRHQDRPKLQYMPLSSPPIIPRRNPSRRKRLPTDFHVSGGDKVSVRDADRSMLVKFSAKDLVMGKVTILKRGEDLKVVDPKVEDIKIEELAMEGIKFEKRRSVEVVKDRKVRFEREDDSVLCSTDRFGPEPETVQKQLTNKQMLNVPKQVTAKEFNVIDLSYSSPEPSSLPFRPPFFSKDF